MANRAVVFVLIGVAVAGLSFLITRKVRSQAVDSWRPFLAVGVERLYSGNDPVHPKTVWYSMYARRGDGSDAQVWSVTSPNGELVESRGFSDVASGRKVSVETLTRSKTTYKLSQSEVGAPSTNCTNDPNAQRKRILGYEVERVEEQSSFPNGKMTVERWQAPALNCYSLRERVTFPPETAFAPSPHNEIEVTLVVEGQPPLSMFEDPPDYVERSPSQLNDEYARKFPGHRVFANPKLFDDAYYAQRPTRYEY